MTHVDQPPQKGGIVQRATNVVLRPTSEWSRIAPEPATVGGLFTGYAMILAAVAPICGLIGGLLFASRTLAVLGVPLSPVNLVISAVLNYIVALLSVLIYGLVIDALAPSFGGVRDRLRAMKTAVYSATPMWLAGVFGLVPMLAFLMLTGLYGIYVLDRGLPILMRAPRKKAAGYTAGVVIVMILVWVVLGELVAWSSVAVGLTPNPLSLGPHRAATAY